MRTNRLKAFAALPVLAALGMAGAMPASAQSSPSGWHYEFSPYLWTTALSGTVQAPGLPPSEVDASFSDLFDNLDFAWSGTFEARNGRWGWIGDLQYYNLGLNGKASHEGPLGNTLTVKAKVDLKQTIFSAAAAYRLVEGLSPVDVFGGVRYTGIDVEATADFTALGLTGSRTRSGDKSWTEPFIGVRLQHALSDRWSLNGTADVGGFGVGSDLTWQLSVGAQYRFSDKYALKFGYRVMDVDYDEDGFVYDMKTDGLYVGMGIRF